MDGPIDGHMYGFADAMMAEAELNKQRKRIWEEEQKKIREYCRSCSKGGEMSGSTFQAKHHNKEAHMTDQEYVKNAVKTENTDFDDILNRMQNIRMLRATHAVFGLQTEAAEITDLFKKHIFYGKPLDEKKVFEETGDAIWYIALLCDTMGFDLEKLKASNIAKLQARYPNKFSSEDALKRDEGKEKAALESEK